MTRTIPYLNTLTRLIPYFNTLTRTIPYLNTLSRTIPYVKTLNRTIPYLKSLNRTRLYLIRLIPCPNTLQSAANQIRVLRHPRALCSGGGPFSALGWSRLAIVCLNTYGPPLHPPSSDLLTLLLLS